MLGISIFAMAPSVGFAVRLTASLLFAVIACLQSFGEEFGWRGYMLTRLFDAKIPMPLFCNGLVWGLWHVPFFYGTLHKVRPEPLSVSLFFFIAGTIASTYLLGYLRLRSGSILAGWPTFPLTLPLKGCPTFRGFRKVGSTSLRSSPSQLSPPLLINQHRPGVAVSIVPVTAPLPLPRFQHQPALHRILMAGWPILATGLHTNKSLEGAPPNAVFVGWGL